MKNGLLESLSQQSSVIILILSLVVLVLFVMVIRLSMQISALRNRWKGLLDGTRGENLESLLHEHLHQRLTLEDLVKLQGRQIETLEAKMLTAKRHLGLVRFDAFEDTGGSQSFAMALYDDNGDGAILTSLLGRNECRVYGKGMSRGRSERNLSQEEQRAISEAESGSPRAIVS